MSILESCIAQLNSARSDDVSNRPVDLNLLTINTGSSSLKMRWYRIGTSETSLFAASVDRIGSPMSRIRIENSAREHLVDLPEITNWHWTADFSDPVGPPAVAQTRVQTFTNA